MRIEFLGSITQIPGLILKFNVDTDWDPTPYIAQGYTNFDVICIAGGGGHGAGYDGPDINDAGIDLRCYGGEGGGGGFHRIFGALDALPNPVPIEVGLGGDDAVDGSEEDGEDGGRSTFYFPACSASGGKGGKGVLYPTIDVKTNANGGQGGLGAESTPGGGGLGGLVGGMVIELGESEPGTDGEDGPLVAYVGKGGGGGAGGTGIYGVGGGFGSGSTRVEATRGGRGSYDPSLLVTGSRGSPSYDTDAETEDTVPGWASGAKTTPLDGTQIVYGRSGQPGIVIIHLTAE